MFEPLPQGAALQLAEHAQPNTGPAGFGHKKQVEADVRGSMAQHEPTVLAVNNWINGSLLIPLLPMLMIIILRWMASDAIGMKQIWCDEIITFALQICITIYTQCEFLRGDQELTIRDIARAEQFRSVARYCGFLMLLALYMVCRDGTDSDKLPDQMRERAQYCTLGIVVVLVAVRSTFSLWIRGLRK